MVDTQRRQTAHSIEAAGHWFLHSGIQHIEGGVARYFRTDLHQNATVSTEITGYAIGTLLYLWERTANDEYLAAAHRSANFLTGVAWDRERRMMPFECAGVDSLSFFFDCGIIVRGLLALYRRSNWTELLTASRAIADSMIVDFAAGEGAHPVIRIADRTPLPYDARWSRRPGCYQLKAALAWHELYVETGEIAYLGAYEQFRSWCVATQDGFLPGNEDPKKVMDRLHAYCYYLEALLSSAGEPEIVELLRNGIERVTKLLRDISPLFQRSDVCAQLLRLRLAASVLADIPLDREAATEEAEWAASYQQQDGPYAGGYWFGTDRGVLLPFLNPVSTSFCMQALDWWHLALDGSLNILPSSVI